MYPPNQGWQPYPQYAPRPPVNGLSIASLVLGIVCCVPPLGLILGLVALSQINKKGERGKGMAVAGIVLSSISTLLMAVSLVTGGYRQAWEGFREGMDEASRSRGTVDLRTGDCFDLPGGDSGDLEGETVDVEVLDCADPHDAEVTGGFKAPGDDYPGVSRLEELADERCRSINSGYATEPADLPEGVSDYYYLPTQQGWRLGDKSVTCAVISADDKLTGSLREYEGPGSALDRSGA